MGCRSLLGTLAIGSPWGPARNPKRQLSALKTGPQDHGLLTNGPADQWTGRPADKRTGGPAHWRTSGPVDQRTSGPADHGAHVTRGTRNETKNKKR